MWIFCARTITKNAHRKFFDFCARQHYNARRQGGNARKSTKMRASTKLLCALLGSISLHSEKCMDY